MKEHRCEECDRIFGSRDSLDMHNQSKHYESYQKPMISRRKKKKIMIFGLVIVAVLILIGLFYWRSIPPKDAPVMELSSDSYLFGTVSQAEGTVSSELTITNAGKSSLMINNMDTSCGCTSAAIVKDGMEGPRFSMANHGTNPKNWKVSVLPGESVQLKIYYNPNVHKDLRGPLTRSIFIYSNSPGNRKQEVKISATQTD